MRIIKLEVEMKPPLSSMGNWQSYLILYILGKKCGEWRMNSHISITDYYTKPRQDVITYVKFISHSNKYT